MSESKEKSEGPLGDGQVPKAVVSRLSLYLRELQHLVRDGRETVSSSQLGELLGFTDAQVRKDLAYFGQFGYPGVGYRCAELVSAIRGILGTDRRWPVIIVGTGNLGRALIGYKGFAQQGFEIVAAFDADPAKVGRTIDGVPVHGVEDLIELVKKEGVKLGIIAVPSDNAQSVADLLVQGGLTAILNFAPLTITLPEGVHQVGVDLAIELEQLSFAVINGLASS